MSEKLIYMLDRQDGFGPKEEREAHIEFYLGVDWRAER